LAYLSTGDIMAHGGINFDFEAIKMIYDWKPKGVLYDSIVLSGLMWPALLQHDFDRMYDRDYIDFPKNLFGSHSLGAWGHRLGEHKGEYRGDKKTVEKYEALIAFAEGSDDEVKELKKEWNTARWAYWNPEMESYGRQDVVVLVAFWNLIKKQRCNMDSVATETHFAHIIHTAVYASLFGYVL